MLLYACGGRSKAPRHLLTTDNLAGLAATVVCENFAGRFFSDRRHCWALYYSAAAIEPQLDFDPAALPTDPGEELAEFTSLVAGLQLS